MRLRVAVAMPEKGGRPAVVACEVRRAPDESGKRRWHFVVGYVERVRDVSIQGAREAARAVADAAGDARPCVFVDCGNAQGLALRRSMRVGWPRRWHRPHAWQRTKFDPTGYAALLEAYADGRVTFLPDLEGRRELDRALVLFRPGGKFSRSEAGDELSSEDEALVSALCLAVLFPSHGPEPRPLQRPPDPEPAPAASSVRGTMSRVG